MKTFTRFLNGRAPGFRGHNFKVDSRTLTVPDAVPTLKEIILSGSQQIVGKPIYDKTFEDGVIRAQIQGAPLDVVFAAMDDLPEEDAKRSDKDDKAKSAGAQNNAPGSAEPEPGQAE